MRKGNKDITIIRWPCLFFYGIGNGVLFSTLFNQTNVAHIIVIEPEIELSELKEEVILTVSDDIDDFLLFFIKS